jgi:hypothetical protein
VTHDGAKKLADLRPRLVSEIREFFVTYNKPRTQIQVQGRGELEKAPKLITAGMKISKRNGGNLRSTIKSPQAHGQDCAFGHWIGVREGTQRNKGSRGAQ